MPKLVLSDYLCSDETTQFTFFKMPRQLINNPQFKQLSTAAKLLYGIMLDRMGLSARNGWHDDAGRVYIYYTVKEVCETMGCGRNKAMRLLAELDTNKGIGLIERIRQGQGKPDRIFVKRITVQKNMETPVTSSTSPAAPVSKVDFSDVQRPENQNSRSRENRPLEVSKADPNKTDTNQTDFIQINLSIYPQDPPQTGWIDRYEQGENLRYLISPRTSPTQNLPPGGRTQGSAAHGAVPASMSFGSTQMTPVRGHSPLKTPGLRNASHRETHLFQHPFRRRYKHNEETKPPCQRVDERTRVPASEKTG